MARSIPLEIFRKKKEIPLQVFLFSRFYRNDRNITVPFAFSHYYHAPWWNTRLLWWERKWNSPFYWKVFKWYTLISFHFVCWKIVLFLLTENYHQFSHTNGKRSRDPGLHCSCGLRSVEFLRLSSVIVVVFKPSCKGTLKIRCSPATRGFAWVYSLHSITSLFGPL